MEVCKLFILIVNRPINMIWGLWVCVDESENDTVGEGSEWSAECECDCLESRLVIVYPPFNDSSLTLQPSQEDPDPPIANIVLTEG